MYTALTILRDVERYIEFGMKYLINIQKHLTLMEDSIYSGPPNLPNPWPRSFDPTKSPPADWMEAVSNPRANALLIRLYPPM